MTELIKNEVIKQISDSLDEEINARVRSFHEELISRKDRYIAEVMKGIRIAHEYNPESMYMDYRIIFINQYELKE